MTLIDLLTSAVRVKDLFYTVNGSLRAKLEDGTVYIYNDGIFEKLVDERSENSQD